MARFENKTVIVTGVGSGMGREIALCFLEEGADVIGLDIANPDPITHDRLTYRHHDVSSESAWTALFTSLPSLGRIDVLVNAAGVIDYAAVDAMEMTVWRRVMSTDLDGVMLGMRAVIPRMRPGGGSIVNFSSIWGLVAVPGAAAYHAAKGAVTQLTRNAAITYGPDNIRVNAIHPGVIATPLVTGQAAEFNKALVERTPLGRMGTPREIAKTVLFMASDDAAFMTGAAIVVDGGWTAQ